MNRVTIRFFRCQ